MKKRIVAVLLAGLVCMSCFAGCGSDSGKQATEPDSKTETVKETKDVKEDDGVIDFEGDGYHLTYLKHETGTDYEGNPCLLLYYTFENKGEENTSAALSAYVKCFQNGVQRDSAYMSGYTDEMNNYMKDVQPGYSVEVCETFSLEDTSDVTIEVEDFISVNGNQDSQVLSLQ